MTRSGFQPVFTITNSITTALTRIERARGFLEAATLSEDWIRAMGARALVLEAHHTTHIEGTHLTLEQSTRLLAGEDVPEANPDDARELLNYRDAFKLVTEHVETGRPITEVLIREIHKRLVDGVRGGEAAPGEYRRVQNYVVNSATGRTIYTPPPPHEVPILMEQLVEWLKREQEIQPVLVSGIAQFQLVHIHPFLDGNGRTSRLLSTMCLYRSGYDFKRLFTISEYYDRNRPAFYQAIQGVRESDMEMTGWLEYFVKGLAVQMGEVSDRGKRAIRADLAVKRHDLNERQSKALGFLVGHDDLRIGDLESLCPDVNRRTLQRDLSNLEDLGLIRRKGAGRRSSYVLGNRKL
ncbi:MAG: Fic family protein [Candidatus Eisenbacteria bacterium]